ncbi:MAG: ASCH domain-containing protein [Acidobacteriota bacterium]
MASAAEMWAEFSAATGVVAEYEAFGFGNPNTPALRDELAVLVRQGVKTATAGHPEEFAAAGEKVPQVGDYWVVVDSRGEAAAVIRTVEVTPTRFEDVDEQFAWDEGEGDRTLAWWRTAHIEYFERAGVSIGPSTVLILERFERVWPL